jgi:hypothetical protein
MPADDPTCELLFILLIDEHNISFKVVAHGSQSRILTSHTAKLEQSSASSSICLSQIISSRRLEQSSPSLVPVFESGVRLAEGIG